ncbi:hypothetical protein KXD40_006759 [Peronospora effusa]|nr:hypothetical protein KXD40_006759 [Peronospora effusa]
MSFNFGDVSGSSCSFSFSNNSSAPSTSTTSSTVPSSGFSFGATSNAAPASSAGFSFGAKSTSTAPSDALSNATATPAAFSFGSAPKPAATSSTTATTGSGAPKDSGFSFGATIPAAEAKSTTTSGFSFGAASTEAKKSTAPTSLEFTFGAKPSVAADAKSGATTTTTAAPISTGGFSFGVTSSDSTKPTEAKSAPAPAPTAFSFGGASAKASSTEASTTTATTTTTPSFAFGTSTASTTDTGTTTAVTSTAATTTAIAAPVTEMDKPPAEYMGRTIEDIINAWSEQLERNADTFTTEAVKVSEWDSDLMDSQKKLGDIAGDVRRIQVAQNELDTNLDTIFAYQMELKSTLEQLEKSVDKMYESQNQMPVTADIEREKTLQLSVDVDDQLNSMTTTLKETVEKLNKAQDDVADENNPMVQIMKVLNVHHNSLQWIEGTSGRINSEIAQLSRKLQNSSI